MDGVVTVVQAGGQYQVVIGNDVPKLYEELNKITSTNASGAGDEEPAETGNILNRFIQLISALFLPILWPLAGAGLLKAFLALGVNFGVLDTATTTYTILNAASDGIFHLLPVFLAVTAAKRFRTNRFTSMAIAAALVYPAIVALFDAGEPVTFFGIPVVMMSYVSSVIPILVGVWIQGYLERFLTKVLPSAIRNFGVPLLVLLIMVPLILITVGPITTYAAQGISAGVTAIFGFAPWLGGAIMGGLWQVFVLFGLHWGFVPIMLNDISLQGWSILAGPLLAAVLAQGAAMVAVAIRTRSKKRRDVAGPAALSGLLAGVTEPGIYGVNLPLKLPFYFGVAGGAIGGAIASAGGSAAEGFVFPSLLAIPAFMNIGSFTLQMIGTGVAMLIPFTLTFLVGPREVPDEVAEAQGLAVVPDQEAAVPEHLTSTTTGVVADADVHRAAGASGSSGAGSTGTMTAPAVAGASAGTGAVAGAAATASTGGIAVGSPMNGRLVALEDVPDPVFSSGAMGAGIAVEPVDGTVRAPLSGTVVVTMDSGHAYGISSPDGAEVLVHVGIDTVNMNGAGFTPRVAKGDQVSAGDVLAEVDLAAIEAAGHPRTTVVIVLNTADLADVSAAPAGEVRAGDTVLTITP